MFAFGHQLSIPFAESYRCLPAYGLDGFGKVLQAQWQVTTDVGRLTIRPDAFDQGLVQIITEVERALTEVRSKRTRKARH